MVPRHRRHRSVLTALPRFTALRFEQSPLSSQQNEDLRAGAVFPSSPCSLSPPLLQREEAPAPRCEHCGRLLKPFPPFEDVCPPSQDWESVSWGGGSAEVCCGKARAHGTALLPFRNSAASITETSTSSS